MTRHPGRRARYPCPDGPGTTLALPGVSQSARKRLSGETSSSLASCASPSRLEALLFGGCARFDRFVFDYFIRRLPEPPSAGLGERLARARRFYADSRFITEPESFFRSPKAPRAEVTWRLPLPRGELDLVTYETDFVPVFPEARGEPHDAGNRRGVMLWWRHHEPGHPVMLCVHGYGGGNLWVESLAFDAARFYWAGVDVAIYVMPYHGARASGRSGAAFFDLDLVRTNEAFARGIYEIRALVRHLRDEGTGPVGAFGMSLGAYTVALLASIERRLAFAVAMIPIVSFADRWWGEGDRDPWVAMAIEHGWTLEAVRDVLRVHEPLSRRALVPRSRRLVIGARGDAICTPAQAEALWRHWERPRIHWYPGGHLLQLRRGVALREVQSLIADAGLLGERPVEPMAPAGNGHRAAVAG